MSSLSPARATLRSATAQHHQIVDQIFARAALDDATGFARFMRAQAGAYLPAEEALERDGAAALMTDWAARRRAALLKDDLAALGVPCPAPVGAVRFASVPAVLGGLYVLEGSRLGGAMLRRSVPQGWPASFLAPGPSGAWRQLIDTLDASLPRQADVDEAVEAACEVFELFAESGRQHIGGES